MSAQDYRTIGTWFGAALLVGTLVISVWPMGSYKSPPRTAVTSTLQ